MLESNPSALSEDQRAVYDRQLRVWGLETQHRLSAARILVIGNDGLAAEVAKNLVLAGAGFVSMADDGTLACSHNHQGNFLVHSSAANDPKLTVASACVQTLSAMNPLIQVTSHPFDLNSEQDDPEAFSHHDTFIASVSFFGQIQKLEAGVMSKGKQLFCSMMRGPNSFTFVNLGRHVYSEKAKEGIKCDPVTIDYPLLASALSVPLSKLNKRTHPMVVVVKSAYELEKVKGRALGPEDFADLKDLAAKMASHEGSIIAPREDLLEEWLVSCGEGHLALAPSSAVVGGIVANHVIRAISGVSQPINNCFFYSLFSNEGAIEKMGV